MKYVNWPKEEGGPFFQIKEARSEFQKAVPLFERAYQATYYAAYDTYYGEVYKKRYSEPDPGFKGMVHKNAEWMNEKLFPKSCLLPKNVPGWKYDDWEDIQDDDDYDFLDTTHHNLNVAVYYTAAVFNYLADQFTQCYFIAEDEVVNVLKSYQIDFLNYMFIAIAGGFATFFSIATYMINEKVLYWVFQLA